MREYERAYDRAPTKPYRTREDVVRASRMRYAMTAPDMFGGRFSSHNVREVATILNHYGYSPLAAKKLLRDGYGPEEIEHRARTGQLASQLGVPRKKIFSRSRRSR